MQIIAVQCGGLVNYTAIFGGVEVKLANCTVTFITSEFGHSDTHQCIALSTIMHRVITKCNNQFFRSLQCSVVHIVVSASLAQSDQQELPDTRSCSASEYGVTA